MSASPSSDNALLSVVSAISAVITLSAIQPYLTFTASIIAIVSGLYTLKGKLFKKK